MLPERNLDSLLRMIPEICAALGRVPGARTFLRAATGREITTWDPRSGTDVTNKILLGALQMELEVLAKRLTEIESQYAVVQAAAQKWQVLGRARDQLVLANAIGEIVELPLDLVKLWVAGQPLNVSFVEKEREVELYRGQERVTRLPKSLIPSLLEILRRWSGTSKTQEISVPVS